MKKFLISILLILLIVLTYFLVVKNVTIFNWTSKSVGDVKELNDNLDKEISISKKQNNQEYPQSITKLETAEKDLKIAKEKYIAKKSYLAENVELGVIKIKQYRIERLWITLQDYAGEEKVDDLKMDIVQASGLEGTYNIEVTVIGDYIPITAFLYDIENDDTLGFKILDFKLGPNITDNSSSQDDEKSEENATVNFNKLKATFRIEGISVEGDGTIFN